MPEDQWPADALIVAPWPTINAASERQRDAEAEADFALVQEIVTRIRDARSEAQVEPARRIPVILAAGAKRRCSSSRRRSSSSSRAPSRRASNASLARKPEQAMALVAGGVEIYLPLAGLLDLAKETQAGIEIVKAQGAVERSRRCWTIRTSSRAPSRRSCSVSATPWPPPRTPSPS